MDRLGHCSDPGYSVAGLGVIQRNVREFIWTAIDKNS
jgi:hypothetical protein